MKFKIGDKVRLSYKGMHPKEFRDWAKIDCITKKDVLIITFINGDGWIEFNGFGYFHPPEKFTLIKPLTKAEKLKDISKRLKANDKEFAKIERDYKRIK